MNDIKIASLQFRCRTNDKFYNLTAIQSLVEQAVRQNFNIICFPEFCVTGRHCISNANQSALARLSEFIPDSIACMYLQQLAQQHGVSIGAGVIEQDASSHKLYNTYLYATSDGRLQHHRKLHSPVSEYLDSGDEYTILDSAQGKVAILSVADDKLTRKVQQESAGHISLFLAPHTAEADGTVMMKAINS